MNIVDNNLFWDDISPLLITSEILARMDTFKAQVRADAPGLTAQTLNLYLLLSVMQWPSASSSSLGWLLDAPDPSPARQLLDVCLKTQSGNWHASWQNHLQGTGGHLAGLSWSLLAWRGRSLLPIIHIWRVDVCVPRAFYKSWITRWQQITKSVCLCQERELSRELPQHISACMLPFLHL